MPKRKKLYVKRLLIHVAFALLELDERLHLSENLNIWPLVERRISPQYHWVGERRRIQQPEGPFPELAARGLVLTISICVAWVTGWALYFATQGWQEGLVIIPLFIAWVFFVLFFRGIKFRMNGVVQ